MPLALCSKTHRWSPPFLGQGHCNGRKKEGYVLPNPEICEPAQDYHAATTPSSIVHSVHHRHTATADCAQ